MYKFYILKLVKSIENILKYLLFIFSRCTHVSSIFNAPYKKDKYEHNNNACHVPRDHVKEVRTDTLLPPTRTVGGRPRVMKSRAAM